MKDYTEKFEVFIEDIDDSKSCTHMLIQPTSDGKYVCLRGFDLAFIRAIYVAIDTGNGLTKQMVYIDNDPSASFGCINIIITEKGKLLIRNDSKYCDGFGFKIPSNANKAAIYVKTDFFDMEILAVQGYPVSKTISLVINNENDDYATLPLCIGDMIKSLPQDNSIVLPEENPR